MQDVEVLLLNEDVAVVAYKVREELTVEDKPAYPRGLRRVHVGAPQRPFRCASHSEAIAGDRFGHSPH